MNFMHASAEWSHPIFKVLANNDTGAAPGHQAGIVIPKALRKYFPSLEAAVSSVQPTVDKRLVAELYVEDKFLGTVSTRYQYQTWADTRSPESRLTDQLGPMRNSAEGGDILIVQRATSGPVSYRLVLVRKGSAAFALVAPRTNNRRWGPLAA